MKKNQKKAFKVGVFVVSALALLVSTIYFIGSKDNLFAPRVNVSSSFQDIRGVVVGNNVRFSGINVGTVRSIEMTPDNLVVITLSIAEKFAPYIYKNSVVEISQDGIMGSKLLNISSGTVETGRIEEGDVLAAKYGVDLEGMMGEVQSILTKASSGVTNLLSIAAKLDSGEGDLGRLINDNTLTSELATTTKKLNSTLTSVDQIAQKINAGQGDLGRLINANDLTEKTYSILDDFGKTVDKTHQVAANLETTTGSINEGDGLISLLLNNKSTAENVDTTILKVQNSLEQFDRTAKAIEESWIVRLFSKKKKKDKHTDVAIQTDSIN